MRDIRFRAWDYEFKCWRFGWLTKLVEGGRRFFAIICDDEDEILTRYYIHNESSIGQFTGLQDKNGVDIYEGDILLIPNAGFKFNFVVGFDENQGSFRCRLTTSDDYYSEHIYGVDNCKVIGNIYQNPELLEDNK